MTCYYIIINKVCKLFIIIHLKLQKQLISNIMLSINQFYTFDACKTIRYLIVLHASNIYN